MGQITVRLTAQQAEMLIAAGAYYETHLEDDDDRAGIGVLNRALEALRDARHKALR